MSRTPLAIACALLVALAAPSAAPAKGSSKLCSLIPRADIGKPVGQMRLRIRSVSTVYPALAGNRGKMTLCDFTGREGVVASSSVTTIGSAGGAREELAAQLKRARAQRLKPQRMRGPWDDAYFLGRDGLLLLEGRHIFTLTYATEARGASKITAAVLARLGKKAASKL